MPITHPTRPDVVLLRPGYVIDTHTIDRLAELRLREVWIRYPGLDFIAEHVCPSVVQAGRGVTAAIGQTFEEVLGSGHAKLQYFVYRRAIQDLLDELIEHPRAGAFIVELAAGSPEILRSAGHGCFMSLLMGMKLETYLMLSRSRLDGYSARDVTSLGIGALLRDIGMLRMPEEARDRWFRSRDESDPGWREHVRMGYDAVRGEVEPAAAAAVLHHHQKFDGTGFPHRTTLAGEDRSVSGQEIHVFARVIAAADCFDRLRYTPSGRTPMVRVLRRMLDGPESTWIDPLVFRGLLHVTPPYPPGSLVKLNNGLHCAVTSWDPLDPCRPDLAVLEHDPLNRARFLEPVEMLRLRDEASLEIVEAEGEHVAGDNFAPSRPGDFDIHRAQGLLISRPPESLRSA